MTDATTKIPQVVQSAADRRDNAIANFFEAATSLLRKVEPLVDAAIARDMKEMKR